MTCLCCGQQWEYEVKVRWTRSWWKTLGVGFWNFNFKYYQEYAGTKVMGEEVHYILLTCCEKKDDQGESEGLPQTVVVKAY